MAEATIGGKVFEEFFQNVRKASEANLGMQQEMMRQWSTLWPGIPTPQTVWLDQVRKFQKQWSNTVSDLARKHREVVDRQYQAAIDSLEEALRVSQAKDPEEFRKRTEELCRKTIDCLREVSEAQMREFQASLSKWSELLTKAGT